jgi:hypothetical protein
LLLAIYAPSLTSSGWELGIGHWALGNVKKRKILYPICSKRFSPIRGAFPLPLPIAHYPLPITPFEVIYLWAVIFESVYHPVGSEVGVDRDGC